MDHSESGIDKKEIKKLVQFQKKLPENELGIYIRGKKFFNVEQQPKNTPTYVSEKKNHVTSFDLPKKYGNLGFIAHNYLAGKYFLDVIEGDEIFVLDGKKRSSRYRVKEIQKFQALDPKNPRSSFIDLETKRRCNVNQVFNEVYKGKGKHRMVLQTCIKKGSNEEWGRLFIIAERDDNLDYAFDNSSR